MKKISLALSLIVLISTILVSCKKDEETRSAEGDVEIYLIKSYETLTNSAQIIDNSVVTQETPLIYYSEIISYDTKNCVLTITDDAKNRFANLNIALEGTAFAVKANNELVYTGYFVSPLSSMIISWTVISYLDFNSNNKLEISLGYPYLMEGQTIPDKRNDSKIIDIFRRDNKLIE